MTVRKTLTGILSVVLISTSLVGCGASEAESILEESVTASTEQTISTEEETTSAETLTVGEAVTETAAKTLTVEDENETESSDAVDVDGDKAEQVEQAVDAALRAFASGDVSAIIDTTDMDVMYYLNFQKKPESKEEIIQAAEEGEVDWLSAEEEFVTWEIQNIAPVGNGTYPELESFLNEDIFNLFLMFSGGDLENYESGNYTSFQAVKEEFDITEIWACQVAAKYDISSESNSQSAEAIQGVEESAATLFVFKMGDEWKLDLPYSSYYAMWYAFSTVSTFNEERYSDNDTTEIGESSDSAK